MSDLRNIALAVVVRDARVLVQQRFRRTQGWVHEFPGGAMDAGERPAQAAARELREETGMTGCAEVAVHSATNAYGGQVHFVVLVAPTGAEPEAIDPIRQQTFHWLKATEIPLENFYPADIAFIEQRLIEYL